MGSSGSFDFLLNFVRALLERKKLIFFGTLVPTLFAIILVLVVDSTYRSEALVNPPQKDQGSLGALGDAAGGMGGLFGSLLQGESGFDDCVSILGSTRFADLVIQKFDLEAVYKYRVPGKPPKKYYHADLVKAFHRNAGYVETEEGAIKLYMQDSSAERATEVVRYMIHLLDSLYTDIQRTSIRQRLKYIDERLMLAEGEMRVVENEFVAFQKRHNLLIPEAQVKLVLQNAAQTEIRLETLKEDMALEAELRGTASPRYRDLQVEKRLMEKSLRGRMSRAKDSTSLIFPTQSVPALAAEYFRLERNFEIRMGVYKYLVQQAELLKLDANKTIQVISVIDPPWVNDKRVSPRRRVVVEAVFILSILFFTTLALLLALWDKYRAENPESSKRLLGEIRAVLPLPKKLRR
jgi:capsule polysaccharide export protein KpsE/RkpR